MLLLLALVVFILVIILFVIFAVILWSSNGEAVVVASTSVTPLGVSIGDVTSVTPLGISIGDEFPIHSQQGEGFILHGELYHYNDSEWIKSSFTFPQQSIRAMKNQSTTDAWDGLSFTSGTKFPTNNLKGDSFVLLPDGDVYKYDGTTWHNTGQNIRGTNGKDGKDGAPGRDGKSMHAGEILPSDAIRGNAFVKLPEGDVWIFTDKWSKTSYNLRGGLPGPRGQTIQSGYALPDPESCMIGDLYILWPGGFIYRLELNSSILTRQWQNTNESVQGQQRGIISSFEVFEGPTAGFFTVPTNVTELQVELTGRQGGTVIHKIVSVTTGQKLNYQLDQNTQFDQLIAEGGPQGRAMQNGVVIKPGRNVDVSRSTEIRNEGKLVIRW